jgi:hypothetical protein
VITLLSLRVGWFGLPCGQSRDCSSAIATIVDTPQRMLRRQPLQDWRPSLFTIVL